MVRFIWFRMTTLVFFLLRILLRSFADEEIQSGKASQENATFKADGDTVQAREFCKERTVRGSGLNRAHLKAQRRHFRADGELRNDRQENHQHDEKSGSRAQAGDASRPHETEEQNQQAAGNAQPVQAGKRIAYDSTGLVAAGENRERTRRDDETE